MNRRRVARFMILVGMASVGVLLVNATAEAATYYVATNGSDANPGTEASPFRTVNKGVGVLSPGDTLLIKSGTYAEALANKIPGGSSWSAPVTVAASPGHTVTLKPDTGYTIIHFVGPTKHYIIVDGLILDGGNLVDNAITFDWTGSSDSPQGAHHVRIKNTEIRNTTKNGVDMREGATFNEFINLRVHDVGTSGAGHGIYLRGSNNVVEYSEVHDNHNCGIQMWHEGASNNIVRYNLVYRNGHKTPSDCGTGIPIGVDGAEPGYAEGNRIYNNMVWGNRAFGIKPWTARVRDTHVYNNTVYNNGGDGISIGSGSTNSQIKNNISWGNGGSEIDNSSASTILSHNLCTGHPSCIVTANPQFVNPAAGNFHLQATSPAINAGVTLAAEGVTQDFECTPRPQGLSYDIGADELGLPGSGCSGPLPGDLNLDGARNLIDVRWIIEMLVGSRVKTAAADLDRDGDVDLADCQALIKLIVGP